MLVTMLDYKEILFLVDGRETCFLLVVVAIEEENMFRHWLMEKSCMTEFLLVSVNDCFSTVVATFLLFLLHFHMDSGWSKGILQGKVFFALRSHR